MKNVIYCDFETQSAVNLTKAKGSQYFADPSTRVVSFVWSVNGALNIWTNPRVRIPPESVASVVKLVKTSGVYKTVTHHEIPIEKFKFPHAYPVCAHNAEAFDSQIAAHHMGYDDPANWIDTIHLCRLHGLPAGLNNACRALGIDGKEDATDLKKLMTAKYKAAELVYPSGTAEQWTRYLRYAVRDVVILEQLHDALENYFDVTDMEREIIKAHTTINARGFPVDVDYANALIDLWDTIARDATEELSTLTGGKLSGAAVRSPAKVKAYLKTIGANLTSLNQKTVEQIINGEDTTGVKLPPKAKEVLELRQLATRSTAGKVSAFVEHADGGRVYRAFQYHGAGPGRWSARGVQPHNIARGVKIDLEKFDSVKSLTLPAIEKEARRIKRTTADVVASLTRGVIAAPDTLLGVIDYAAVEARGVAWLAGCSRLLSAFANGVDVYCDFGGMLFERIITKSDVAERFLSKTIVLGCGYQMGAGKFEGVCESNGVDLGAVGLTGKICVDTYRKAYPEIVELWNKAQKSVVRAIQFHGTVTSIGNVCDCVFNGQHMAIILPSGRTLRYWGACVRMEIPKGWNSDKPVPHIYYDSGRGFEAGLYGGKIVENIVQGLCRDILAQKIVELERKRLPVVLHVHDEIVSRLKKPADIKTQARIMSTPPEWAHGFPLEVEGFTATRYGKSTYGDNIHVNARLGKIL